MARHSNGWVKVYHRVVEEDIGQRGNFYLGVFVRLLRMANWKDGSTPVGGQRVVLKAGQLVTGLRELSPDLKEDPHLNRIRNALKYLETRGTIAQEPSNQGRLITICNWSDYQGRSESIEPEFTSEPQAEHKQSTSEAQHSEDIRKKKKTNTARTGVRTEYSPEFEGIWESYQRRGDKKASWDAFNKLNLAPEEFALLKSAIAGYCRKNPEAKYRLHFQRFLVSDWREHVTSPSAPKPAPTLEDVLNGRF